MSTGLPAAMIETALPLPLVRRGKVRDVYAVDDDRLLLVTTDRISAFDVVMNEAIPYKGAVLTHGNFAANALALTSSWEFTSDDRYLAVLPLFHVHGLANGLHCWLFSGCHLRLTERFEHAKAAQWFDELRPKRDRIPDGKLIELSLD